MPNIEIHGLPKKKANGLRKSIFELFSDRHYVDEMVVTVYMTDCRDKDGKSQPFLRLVNSCQNSSQEILGRLSALEMDIEHATLEAFLQKKETSLIRKFF